MPVIAMLAYSGFSTWALFSLYLSLGLCFWVLALAWEWKPWRLAAAAPILALAYLARRCRCFWTAGCWRTLCCRPTAPARSPAWLPFSAGHGPVPELVDPKFISDGSLQRVFMTSGTNTSWTFDSKYSCVVGLVCCFGDDVSEFVATMGNAPRGSSSFLPIGASSVRGVFALPLRWRFRALHAMGIHLEPWHWVWPVCICGCWEGPAAHVGALRAWWGGAHLLLFPLPGWRRTALNETRWKTGRKV